MTAIGDLLYSDVENELRSTVRSVLDGRSDAAAVLQRIESDEPYDPALWTVLASEVGAAALAVPEAMGGAGASWREMAVVAEEIGRAVAPVPFLGSAVLATRILMTCGETELLGRLASGEATATVAVPLSTTPGGAFPSTVELSDGTLSGAVGGVVDAAVADHFVVPVMADGGQALNVVAASDTTVEPVVSMDQTRPLCTVTFAAAGQRIADGAPAQHALDDALAAAAAMLASEQLGVAERCLQMTIDHLKTRYQFGRPVGSFQALKHRLADLWVEVTQARAVARYAAACVAGDDPDTAVAVAVAQAHCSAVAVRAAEECVQMHGGIGFTWEHPAHLYLKRAKTASIAMGSADRHRTRLADLVDLPAPRTR